MRMTNKLFLSFVALSFLAGNASAAWTIAVLPDTQQFMNANNAHRFEAQTQWIVDNRDAMSIEIVLHEGDITDRNEEYEWLIAKSAISTLDGQIPYMLSLGNHDFLPFPWPFDDADRGLTNVNDYFSLADNPLNSIVTERVAGDLANTYSTFTASDGRNVLILNVDYLPSTDILTWAGSIADQYADHTAIVLTHANINEGDAINGVPTSVRNDYSQWLWDTFTSQHENIEIVLNGHALDGDDPDPDGKLTTARMSTIGLAGNTVHEIAFNAQQEQRAYLRLLEFLDDGTTVQVRTYSPTLDHWITDDLNEFQITLSPLDPLMVWENNYGETTDGLDFLVWQRGSPAIKTVPEPSAALLMISVLLCFVMLRRG